MRRALPLILLLVVLGGVGLALALERPRDPGSLGPAVVAPVVHRTGQAGSHRHPKRPDRSPSTPSPRRTPAPAQPVPATNPGARPLPAPVAPRAGDDDDDGDDAFDDRDDDRNDDRDNDRRPEED